MRDNIEFTGLASGGSVEFTITPAVTARYIIIFAVSHRGASSIGDTNASAHWQAKIYDNDTSQSVNIPDRPEISITSGRSYNQEVSAIGFALMYKNHVCTCTFINYTGVSTDSVNNSKCSITLIPVELH